MPRLGSLIRRLRNGKGLSLRQFAFKINKSPAFITKLEVYNEKPSDETLLKIAKILGHRTEIFKAANRVDPDIKKLLRNKELSKTLLNLAKLNHKNQQKIIKLFNKKIINCG